MAQEVGDISVELGKLGSDNKKEGFLADKYKKSKEITPIESEYVGSPQYKFDPFKTDEQRGYEKELASDEALESAGAFRTAQGDLGFTLGTPKNIYDEATSGVTNYDNPKGAFDNDNISAFKGLKFSGGIKSIYSKPKKISDQLGFGGAMVSAITSGFPVGSAWSWIAGGWQQRKDQEKFLSDFGKNGFQALSQGGFKEGPAAQYDKTWEYAQIYGDSVRKNAKTYLRDIFFNNPNPSKLIKDNMYGGKNYSGNAFDATKNYITQGLQTGIFQPDEIRQVADGYQSLKMGTAEWVKSKMAKEVLETEGWKIKGNVMIDPSGQQYVHGEKWTPKEGGKKDFSTIFDKEPTVTKTEPVVTKTEPVITKTEPVVTKPEPTIHVPHDITPEPKVESSRPEPKGAGPSRSQQRISSPSPVRSARESFAKFGRQEGGKVQKLALGDTVENDAGNLEIVNESGKDQTGVADDVDRTKKSGKPLEEGDFVINAPASEMQGYSDIAKMVKNAEQELAIQGIKVDYKTRDGNVDVKVSNKEVIIPKIIAQQIGYDRLEKINNRGKKRVAEIEEEKKQKQGFTQQQVPEQRVEPQKPQPKSMLAQTGGQITLEENKNQPIAVPRESFATMSSVGKRLLSPLSPEQADKELTELSKPSQSFEGFMKPIRMKKGDTVQKDITRKYDFTNEKDVQDYNRDKITRMIMTEALDNPKEWEAMTNVVLNRVKDYSEYRPSDQGKTDIENIILGKNQFQGLKDNQEIYNNPESTVQGLDKYMKISNIVQNILEGKIEDNTDGATFFDKSFTGAGIKFGDHWFHKGKSIIPEIKPKPKPQQTGMMAVN